MATEYSRRDRLAQAIQQGLASAIQIEMRDPRVGWITVSAVELSRDLSYAKVFITALGDREKAEASLKVLNRAAGFLRHTLAERVPLRFVPQLAFFYDSATEQAMRVANLIEGVADPQQSEE